MAGKRYLAPWRRAAAATRPVAQGAGEAEREEVLAALEGKPALYHCVSRVVWREVVFGEAEKEKFVGLMRKWEGFSGVRVLTFCMMGNHFHLLVEVPERPEEEPTDEELLERLGMVYGGRKLAEVRWELGHLRSEGNHGAAEAMRRRFLGRMWDLSAFMKDFKQECSVWWNRRHGKKGHLWEQRFKSVLVEDGRAARVVAAYIDLNPVRAGIAAEAGDYRWSGWGEAAAGRGKAREGIRQVMLERELGRSGTERALGDVSDWADVMRGYGALMAGDEERRRKGGPGAGNGEGEVSRDARRGRTGAKGPVGRRRASGDGAEAPQGGRGGPDRGLRGMGEAEMVRRKVRYFVDGMVVGTEGFVDGVFRLTREWFGGKRTSGARKMAGAGTPLRSMRALRVSPYG